MTGTEARKLSDDQLKTEIRATRDKLFQLRNQAQTEKVENVAQFVAIRRDIARMLTEQSARRAKGKAQPAKAPRAPKAAPKAAAKPRKVARVTKKPAAAKSK